MSTTATLPLMLELTQPAKISPLAGDMVERFDLANIHYNSETQVRENSEGIPQFFNMETRTYYPGVGDYLDDDDDNPQYPSDANTQACSFKQN